MSPREEWAETLGDRYGEKTSRPRHKTDGRGKVQMPVGLPGYGSSQQGRN